MRVVSGPVGSEQIHFEAPSAVMLDKEMGQFLSWWDDSLGKVEGLVRAALVHLWFLTIHPFD